MKTSQELKEAQTKWREVTEDEILRDRALRLEIATLDQNTWIKDAKMEGIEIGIEQGIEQNKHILAKKMIEKNYSIDEIIELTGLNKTEVDNLKNMETIK